MAELFAPSNAPFTIALLLMVFIGVLEIVGMLIGLAPSEAVDAMLPDFDLGADADLDVPETGGMMDADVPVTLDAHDLGPLSQFFGWLGVGRVPVLILFVVMLAAFGLSGLVLQGAISAATGWALPSIIASALAVFPMLAITRVSSRALGRIMPRDETEAVSSTTFIGRVATITRGEAKAGLLAEAKLTDSHGQTHYVQIEPDNNSDHFPQGAQVLIVKQAGARYRVIEAAHEGLTAA